MIALLISFLFSYFLSQDLNSFNIVPLPQSLKIGQGYFQITNMTFIYLPDLSEDMHDSVSFLVDLISASTRFVLPVVDQSKITTHPNTDYVWCTIDKSGIVSNPEGYHLVVTAEGIEITAMFPVGIFYAMQTLRQLLPSSIEGKGASLNDLKIPACTIDDFPQFKYRGFMLDMSRHFSDYIKVMKYIDICAMHKINTFHWHLVDNPGWRLELPNFPELTNIGAWRDNDTAVGHMHTHMHNAEDLHNHNHRHHHHEHTHAHTHAHSNVYGGYYSQGEVREVLAYARKRFITVLPEIEMPGHSHAALLSDPQYSCIGKLDNTTFIEVYCTRNETIEFLQRVLRDVFDIFPVVSQEEYDNPTTRWYPPSARLIHIGGDEVNKTTTWGKCDQCKAVMKENNLTTLDELQSYFIKRIETYVNTVGNRSIIGWDEILQGGLAPGAAVMSWRSYDGGRDAAAQGHQAVMAPTSHLYLNHPQEGQEDLLLMSKVYTFNPLPPDPTDAEKKFIVGGQACLWRNTVFLDADVEYLMMPRVSAFAETVWSAPEQLDYDYFVRRLVNGMVLKYKALGFNYCRLYLPDVQIINGSSRLLPAYGIVRSSEKIKAQLCTDVENPDVRHALAYTVQDEWAEYAIDVQKPGIYRVYPRISALNATGAFELDLDDTPVARYVVDGATGSWDTFKTIGKQAREVELLAGKHTLKILITESAVNIDIIYFDFVQ